jgi:membrane protein implicated in regulation of membrane protease activity
MADEIAPGACAVQTKAGLSEVVMFDLLRAWWPWSAIVPIVLVLLLTLAIRIWYRNRRARSRLNTKEVRVVRERLKEQGSHDPLSRRPVDSGLRPPDSTGQAGPDRQ